MTLENLIRVPVTNSDLNSNRLQKANITYTIFNKNVIILLQQSIFWRFSAKYYHLFVLIMVSVIFAVLELSLCALTIVVKLL